MAEVNRFESRLTHRGGRIIDVESSISQDPAISPQGGEGASYTPVNPLPSGEDTAPYMPIAPIAPGELPQPPAPDQYESWPPRMISLAEGARVDNIAGRPIHEFTGIQPGNINPIEPAAPGAPKVTIGFDSAFSNVVNSRPLPGLSPNPWESGLGTMFGTEASDGISTIGRLPGGARLAPHPGEEQGGSEIGGSTPGRGIVIDDDKRTAPPPKPGPGDEPPPGERPCDCLLLVDYQEFPPQHGRRRGQRRDGTGAVRVSPGDSFFLRAELFEGPEPEKPWGFWCYRLVDGKRGSQLYSEFSFHDGNKAGRVAAEKGDPESKQGVRSGKAPCPSTVARWVTVKKEGEYEIAFVWGKLRCTVRISCVQQYALGVPQECGCSVLCYDLDIKGMPEVDMDPAKQVASANCQIKVDSTDSLNGPDNFGSANFGFTQVLGILRLTGNDITDKKYHWTLDCEGDYLEFTRDIRLDPHTLKAAPADDAEFKCHDEGDDICGTPIPFIVRPTQKALDEFLTGRRFPLVDKIIGVVGKQRCPIRIVISNFCDEVQFGKYIADSREPAEVTFEEPQGYLTQPDEDPQWGQITYSSEGEALDEYSHFSVVARIDIDLTLDYRWSPPDCCCVFIAKAAVRLRIWVSLSSGWNDQPWENQKEAALRVSAPILQAYEDDSKDGFREAVRDLCSDMMECRKAAKADCADVADIDGQWESVLTDSIARMLQIPKAIGASTSLPDPTCVPQSRSREVGVIAVDARGALEYVPAEPTTLQKLFPIEWSKAVAIPSFSMDKVLRALRVFKKKPCCILIWVHGYNTTLVEAQTNIRRLEKMYQTDAEGCCKIFGYCWNGNPPDEKDFGAAISAATLSVAGLVSLVHYLKSTYPGVPISIGAHSLGNYVMFQAMELLSQGDIQFLFSIQAAINNKVFNRDRDGRFHKQLEKVEKTYIVYNKYDNVLADFFGTLLKLGFATKGVYEVFSGEEALGETGPKYRQDLPPGKVVLWDMSSRWRFEKVDLPGDELDRTTHSAIYYWNVSYSFWRNEIRGALDASVAGCNVR